MSDRRSQVPRVVHLCPVMRGGPSVWHYRRSDSALWPDQRHSDEAGPVGCGPTRREPSSQDQRVFAGPAESTICGYGFDAACQLPAGHDGSCDARFPFAAPSESARVVSGGEPQRWESEDELALAIAEALRNSDLLNFDSAHAAQIAARVAMRGPK